MKLNEIKIINFDSKNFRIFDDNVPEDSLPVNFRAMQKYETLENKVSILGLDKLYASGSGQFSPNGLSYIKDFFKNYDLQIVDLRQEFHNFVNDTAVRYLQFGTPPYDESENQENTKEIKVQTNKLEKNKNNLKTQNNVNNVPDDQNIQFENQNLEEKNNYIEKKEIILGEQLKSQEIEIFKLYHKHTPFGLEHKYRIYSLKVNSVYNEKFLCEEKNIEHKRMVIEENHTPKLNDIDYIIPFLKKMHAQKKWMHFHCRLGLGRTTTMLAMYDMLINAKLVSFDDILLRQYLIGGHDLTTPDVIGGLDFLHKFYKICLL